MCAGGVAPQATAAARWAWIEPLAAAPVAGWFVDARDRLVGLLDFDGRRAEVATSRPATAGQRIVFHGYGSVAADSGAIGLIVRAADGVLYRSDFTHPLARNSRTSGRRSARPACRAWVGEPIVGTAAQIDGAFAPTSPPPGSGAAFAGTGPGTGAIRLGPFCAPPTVLVPLRTAPSPFGTAAQIVDVDGGAVLRSLWPATHGEWRIWRADVPASAVGRSVMVVVTEPGTRSSQAVAIALPALPARPK